MCGIAGYIGKQTMDQGRIDTTLQLMDNRGPDAKGHKVIEDAVNVYLLHSRLSIIDLDSRADQPFTIGHCTIIFNGEIYNYVELRKRLEDDGVVFHTNSDTEVLLQSYMRYGKNCVDHFEGMWAFAIYDSHTKELFISRDRFAEKPLYYYEADEGFYFGSEIKFIQNMMKGILDVNYQHIYRYLVNGYKSLYKTKETYFKDLYEIPFATNVSINTSLNISMDRYWQPQFRPQKMSMNQAVEGFRERLIESMRIRLRSDVPVSFCLSGGIDSSSLVSIAAKKLNADIHTFSLIDEDERYNELDNIQATLDDIGAKNTIIHISSDNAVDRLKNLVRYHDQPVGTITFLIHSYITEAVAKEGYKVVFAGHAADELVTGYYDHFLLHLHEMRNHPEYAKHLEGWKKHILPVVRNPHLQNPDLYAQNISFRDHIYLNCNVFSGLLKEDFNEGFTEEKYTDALLRNRMLNELFHEGVRFILHEDDLNAMFYSIENRCPYLDKDLFEFSYSIPTEHLIQEGCAKHILREAMDGILNDQVRLDRQKRGFNASINTVFNFDDPKVIDYLLEPSPVFDLIDREKLMPILKMETIPNSYSKFLFNFINSKIFLEQVGAVAV